MLRSLPRKQEGHGGVIERLQPRGQTLPIALRQARDRFGHIPRDDGAAAWERATANLERPGSVGKVQVRMSPQILIKVRSGILQRSFRTR